MQSAIETLIVDGDSSARQLLREELDLIPEVRVVGEAANGTEALHQIAELQPDVVFLDLQMPGMTGFEVIQRLRGTWLPVVVVVSAFKRQAIDAFEAEGVDYLLKPLNRERLRRAIEQAKSLIGKPREIARELAKIEAANDPPNALAPPQRLVGRIGREYFLLDPDEVLALQAERELVWIITQKRRFLANEPLHVIETRLHPASFQRVHRNAIVNVRHVRKMSALTSNRWLVTLSNEAQFVVSKRQAHQVRRILQEEWPARS